MSEKGKLYLIPTTLGDIEPLEVLPYSIRYLIENINTYIVENEKVARAFIKKICPKKSQPDLEFHLLNKFTEPADVPSFLAKCHEGTNIGLMSDAGVPAIADPGATVVRQAHSQNVPVWPLVGPSSILLAMMASGMNGQNFAFNGYLPIDKGEKNALLRKLEKRAHQENQSQIFIETPYRNKKLFEDFLKMLSPNTMLCVACDITLPTQYIKAMSIKEWKSHKKADLHKRPAIFIMGS